MNEHPGDYGLLSREALEARLKVAEDTLTFIGWSSPPLTDGDGPRTDAAIQMWMTWAHMVPGGCPGPKERPDLVRMEPMLAEARQRIRTATLARIRAAESGSSGGSYV